LPRPRFATVNLAVVLERAAETLATGIMKRKLDQNDEAQPVTEPQPAETKPGKTVEVEPSFADLGLDPRLVQAVALQNFEKPTLVQRKAIPLALTGKDVMAKAPCGSGKTAAFVLPVVSSILTRKAVRIPILSPRRTVLHWMPQANHMARPTLLLTLLP
jgi:ATP-dependent RNA helicase DDX56/DBP9